MRRSSSRAGLIASGNSVVTIDEEDQRLDHLIPVPDREPQIARDHQTERALPSPADVHQCSSSVRTPGASLQQQLMRGRQDHPAARRCSAMHDSNSAMPAASRFVIGSSRIHSGARVSRMRAMATRRFCPADSARAGRSAHCCDLQPRERLAQLLPLDADGAEPTP